MLVANGKVWQGGALPAARFAPWDLPAERIGLLVLNPLSTTFVSLVCIWTLVAGRCGVTVSFALFSDGFIILCSLTGLQFRLSILLVWQLLEIFPRESGGSLRS